jgi:hypothetical protein
VEARQQRPELVGKRRQRRRRKAARFPPAVRDGPAARVAVVDGRLYERDALAARLALGDLLGVGGRRR